MPTESLRSSVENLVAVASRKKDELISVQFDIHVNDDLNNRFKPIDNLLTDAILSIDDDVLVPCSSLETAFSVWTSAPNSMVGFVPRMHWVKAKVRVSLSLLALGTKFVVLDASFIHFISSLVFDQALNFFC